MMESSRATLCRAPILLQRENLMMMTMMMMRMMIMISLDRKPHHGQVSLVVTWWDPLRNHIIVLSSAVLTPCYLCHLFSVDKCKAEIKNKIIVRVDICNILIQLWMWKILNHTQRRVIGFIVWILPLPKVCRGVRSPMSLKMTLSFIFRAETHSFLSICHTMNDIKAQLQLYKSKSLSKWFLCADWPLPVWSRWNWRQFFTGQS